MKIALGVFDGVHLGHQKVIERAHRVITFHPHPNRGVHLLTTVAERKDLVNNLDVIPFTPKLGSLTAEEFIRDVLVKKFKPTTVCIGEDYAFGYNRNGDVSFLQELGKKYNFTVEVIAEVTVKGKPVRSSRIRHLLGEGKVEAAADLLGRNYQLSGEVVPGRGVGRKLGFPTANIKTDSNKLVPGAGVYAASVIIENHLFKGAVSIGERPTFKGHAVVVEVHIPGFAHNIYRKRLTILFEKFLRQQKKFKNQAQLKCQIKKDLKKL